MTMILEKQLLMPMNPRGALKPFPNKRFKTASSLPRNAHHSKIIPRSNHANHKTSGAKLIGHKVELFRHNERSDV